MVVGVWYVGGIVVIIGNDYVVVVSELVWFDCVCYGGMVVIVWYCFGG